MYRWIMKVISLENIVISTAVEKSLNYIKRFLHFATLHSS